VKVFEVRSVAALSVSPDIDPLPPLALKVTVYVVGGGEPPPPDGTVVVVVGGLGGAGGVTTTVVPVWTVTAFDRDEFGPLPCLLSAWTVKRYVTLFFRGPMSQDVPLVTHENPEGCATAR
jgi:hypothetical protein